MDFPPSLPAEVLARSFRANNGELGLLDSDALAFLDACDCDRLAILGWELWLVDHVWNAGFEEPTPAPGYWCGGIPFIGETLECCLHGDGDATQTRAQLAKLDLPALIETRWLRHVRINFTLMPLEQAFTAPS